MTAEQPLCACGTFAIGRCVKCGRWVCGRHSQLARERAGDPESRLCDDDFAPIARRWEEELERESAEKYARLERQREEHEQAAAVARKRKQNERVLVWAIYAAVVGGVFWWARSQGESGPASLAIAGAVAGFGRPYARDKRYDEHDRFWSAVWGAAIFAGLGYVIGLILY